MFTSLRQMLSLFLLLLWFVVVAVAVVVVVVVVVAAVAVVAVVVAVAGVVVWELSNPRFPFLSAGMLDWTDPLVAVVVVSMASGGWLVPSCVRLRLLVVVLLLFVVVAVVVVVLVVVAVVAARSRLLNTVRGPEFDSSFLPISPAHLLSYIHAFFYLFVLLLLLPLLLSLLFLLLLFVVVVLVGCCCCCWLLWLLLFLLFSSLHAEFFWRPEKNSGARSVNMNLTLLPVVC
ncbi:unnamed protein product [Polarella glacialis]|uniref:Uncharacterized protein n=2 Tax=Polarella glacialis TaxID=89957 RepID=A0A813FRT8_POLGL|nr:unnamed protein product [Polarella glacialis]